MLFPDNQFDQACIDEFNEVSALEYERVRDFIILHYKATMRSDTEFWRKCANMDIPDTLNKKMELFKKRGYFARYRWEMFHPASWLAIYTGFNFHPESYDPGVDAFNEAQLTQSLAAMKKSVKQFVKETPKHKQFLDSLYESSV